MLAGLAMLFDWRRRREVPGAVAVAPSEPQSPAPVVRDGSETIRLTQADVFRSAREVGEANLDLRRRLRDAFGLLERLRGQARTFSDMASTARNGAGAISQALHDLGEASQTISTRVNRSRDTVDDAEARAARASQGVGQLRDSVAEIGEVVSLIASIARQTNLLALNATIEAARAGEAGRGFAVVAAEVKALSTATQEATGRISATIDRVRGHAMSSIDDVTALGASISELRRAFVTVAEAVSMQVAKTAEIGMSAVDAARFAEEVHVEAGKIDGLGREAVQLADQAEQAAERADRTIALLGDFSSMLVRQVEVESPSADRLPVSLNATLRLGDRTLVVRTENLSPRGAFVRTQSPLLDHVGDTGQLDVEGVGRFDVSIVNIRRAGIALRLTGSEGAAQNALDRLLKRLASSFQAPIIRVRELAATIETGLGDALAGHEDRLALLFKAPEGVRGRTVTPEWLDRSLDEALEREERPDGTARETAILVMDAYGQVRCVKGSRVVSHALRAKRLDDPASLGAARHLGAAFVQNLILDLASQGPEDVSGVSAPVFVAGRHWGCVSLLYCRGPGLDATTM